MSELRRLASQGIPDGAGVRSAVWKVFYLSSVNSFDVVIVRFYNFLFAIYFSCYWGISLVIEHFGLLKWTRRGLSTRTLKMNF